MILLKSREVTHFEQMMKWQPTWFNISSYICNIYIWVGCLNGENATMVTKLLEKKKRESNTGNWNAYAEPA